MDPEELEQLDQEETQDTGQTQSEESEDQQDSQDEGSTESQQGETSSATQQQATPVGMSKEDLREVLASVTAANQANAQPQKELSPEEVAKAFNVYEIPAPMVQRLAGEDPEVQKEVLGHFQQMRDGLVRQALTISAYQQQLLKDQMMQQLAPALQMAQGVYQQEQRKRFFEEYPDLAGVEPLLEEIRDNMIAKGVKFDSEKHAFTEVAKRARAVLAKLPRTEGGNGGQGAQGQTQQSANRMSTVSSGGQGGVGASNKGGGKNRPAWLEALE